MKPADLFIGVRQLFGVWIPGLVWVISICLAVGHVDPVENLDCYSWREVFAALIFAYLLALVVRGLSFRVGLVISYWLHRGAAKIGGRLTAWGMIKPLAKFARRVLHDPFGSALLASNPSGANPPIQRLAHEHVARVLRRAGIPEADVQLLEPSALDEIAQQSILGVDRLAQRTDDAQAELDLYASLLLPIIGLTVALFIYWATPHNSESFFGKCYGLVWITGLIIAFIGIAWKIQLRRQAEQIDWYHMTLALALAAQVNQDAEAGEGVPAP